MKNKMKKAANKLWKAVLSPKMIVAFKVAGFALQAFHEIESFRTNHKGRKVGFQFPGDEE